MGNALLADRRSFGETELSPYKPLCGPAMASLILGLSSLLALAPWPLLTALPIAAVVTGAWALWRLRNVGDGMSGARHARVGITLGVVFGLADPLSVYLPRHFLIEGAKEVGQNWLQAMADGKPERSVLLSWPPAERPPADSEWAILRRIDRNLDDAFNELQKLPLPRRLGELGDAAKISFVGVDDYSEDRQTAMANLVYRVRFTRTGTKKRGAFDVLLAMQSARDPRTGRPGWQVNNHLAPYQRHSVKIERKPTGHSHFGGDSHEH